MGKMEYLGDPDCHFWLTRSMARSMGLNLSESLQAEQLHADDYAQMVARCRKCAHVRECQMWLANCLGEAARAPSFCIHRDMLNALKENQEREGKIE
ncbi:MAG: hypothetical protein FH759_00410 [Sediminimonas qiaohouensis]|uniref:DUF6455 domain-containing protein n=1 Tax=Sediminimonas qiaohouensis TaxID=552061 RepID=A0A7C9L9I3_9RHOB|nr:DUF6455 family protein [Sediminimonas qiaohouensis]MTJ03138.1 hypothetical protein [Sediminimonas qiaohouensis]